MSRATSAGLTVGPAPSNDPLPTQFFTILPIPTDSDDEGTDTRADSTSGLPTPGTAVTSRSASTSATTTTSEIPALTTSPNIQSDSQNAMANNGQSQNIPPGAIVGILLAVLLVIGLVLFFVRRHFVLRRAEKNTPARSRLSRLVISGPSDFQHVASASNFPNVGGAPSARDFAGGSAERGEMWNSPGAGGIAGWKESPSRPAEEAGAWATSESPYARRQPKQKYTVDFGNLDSGLHDHVRTMQGARKAPPGM